MHRSCPAPGLLVLYLSVDVSGRSCWMLLYHSVMPVSTLLKHVHWHRLLPLGEKMAKS
jgi:hypothetical protein